MISEGRRHIESGRATTMPVLLDQLKRTRCAVKLTPASRNPMTTAQIYKDRISGVLMVGSIYKCDKCQNWHTGTAGGFLLTEDGVFVTNYHVVKKQWGRNQTMMIMNAAGDVFPVTAVLAASEIEDVAICQADTAGRKLTPVALSTAAPVGSNVVVISHPESRWYTLSQGIISRYYREQHRDGKTASRLAITADFAKGSSGGPLFNERGDVIGMVSSTHSVYYDTAAGQPANLQMVFKQCIPAESILSLINPPPPPLP